MNNLFIEKQIQGTHSGSKMLKSLSSNSHSRNIKKIAKTLHTDAFWPPAFLRVCQDPFSYRYIFEPNQRAPSGIIKRRSFQHVAQKKNTFTIFIFL